MYKKIDLFVHKSCKMYMYFVCKLHCNLQVPSPHCWNIFLVTIIIHWVKFQLIIESSPFQLLIIETCSYFQFPIMLQSAYSKKICTRIVFFFNLNDSNLIWYLYFKNWKHSWKKKEKIFSIHFSTSAGPPLICIIVIFSSPWQISLIFYQHIQ